MLDSREMLWCVASGGVTCYFAGLAAACRYARKPGSFSEPRVFKAALFGAVLGAGLCYLVRSDGLPTLCP